MIKIQHDAFQFAFRHLPMRHFYPRFRYQLSQLPRHLFHGFDFIVQKEHLTAALDFTQAGFPDLRVHPFADKGLDGMAVGRWTGDNGNIPQARHRHIQCPGDRRGGERQHIQLATQFFEVFFLPHAETVFLINHHQSQFFKLELLGQ